MNDPLSYFGLVDTRISAFDKDLPVQKTGLQTPGSTNQNQNGPRNRATFTFRSKLRFCNLPKGTIHILR